MAACQRRLSLLHLASLFPYPPRSGYDHRVWQICRYEARNADVKVLCRIIKFSSEEIQRAEEKSGISFDCLELPRPGAIKKAMKGLRFLFSRDPIMSAGWFFPEMQRAVYNSIKAQPDVVVFEGIWNAIYWPQLKFFQGLKVLNYYDLQIDSLRRQAAVLRPCLNKYLLLNASRRLSDVERAVFNTADLVWVTSNVELQKANQIYPNVNFEVAPNGVDCSSKKIIPLTRSKEILFVGSLSYGPNIDAVSLFASEIMPLVLARKPDAIFRVVGRNPSAKILALHSPPQVIISGEVDSLELSYSRAALCVVPIRTGGGTRLKILEAMAYGRPVVSTTFGAEGLEIENGKHLILADTPAEIAQAILHVLLGPENTSELIARARELVETRYDWEQISKDMYNRYTELIANKSPCISYESKGR